MVRRGGQYAQVAAQGLVELTRWTVDDIQPPLYYYLLAGWTRVAGHSEALRLPSVLFGTATVALLWVTAAAVRAQIRRASRDRRDASGRPVAPLRLLRPGSADVHAADVFRRAGRAPCCAASGRAQPSHGGPHSSWQGWLCLHALFRASSFWSPSQRALLLFVSAAGVARLGPAVGEAALRGVAAFASIGLGYLPWLFAMLTLPRRCVLLAGPAEARRGAAARRPEPHHGCAWRRCSRGMRCGGCRGLRRDRFALVGLARLGRAAPLGQAGTLPSWPVACRRRRAGRNGAPAGLK